MEETISYKAADALRKRSMCTHTRTHTPTDTHRVHVPAHTTHTRALLCTQKCTRPSTCTHAHLQANFVTKTNEFDAFGNSSGLATWLI